MLEWNVFIEDNQELTVYNVFNNYSFLDSLVRMFKEIDKETVKYIKDTPKLSDRKLEKFAAQKEKMMEEARSEAFRITRQAL